MRIAFVLLSLLALAAHASPPPVAIDSIAEFRAAGALAMQADLKSALPHLLRVYDAEFLVDAVESTRARLQSAR